MPIYSISYSHEEVLVHKRIDTRQGIGFDQIVIEQVIRMEHLVVRDEILFFEEMIGQIDRVADRRKDAAHLIR